MAQWIKIRIIHEGKPREQLIPADAYRFTPIARGTLLLPLLDGQPLVSDEGLDEIEAKIAGDSRRLARLRLRQLFSPRRGNGKLNEGGGK